MATKKPSSTQPIESPTTLLDITGQGYAPEAEMPTFDPTSYGQTIAAAQPIRQTGIGAASINEGFKQVAPPTAFDFYARGGLGNTITDTWNEAQARRAEENRKKLFQLLLMQGRKGAEQYKSYLKMVYGDEVLAVVPPVDAYIDPTTGMFDGVKWYGAATVGTNNLLSNRDKQATQLRESNKFALDAAKAQAEVGFKAAEEQRLQGSAEETARHNRAAESIDLIRASKTSASAKKDDWAKLAQNFQTQVMNVEKEIGDIDNQIVQLGKKTSTFEYDKLTPDQEKQKDAAMDKELKKRKKDLQRKAKDIQKKAQYAESELGIPTSAEDQTEPSQEAAQIAEEIGQAMATSFPNVPTAGSIAAGTVAPAVADSYVGTLAERIASRVAQTFGIDTTSQYFPQKTGIIAALKQGNSADEIIEAYLQRYRSIGLNPRSLQAGPSTITNPSGAGIQIPRQITGGAY